MFGASSLNTVMQMVAGGYGVTLIPQIAADVERRDARVKFLRLENPQPGRSIGLVFRRTSPRKADFAALGEVVKESVEPLTREAVGAKRGAADRRPFPPPLPLAGGGPGRGCFSESSAQQPSGGESPHPNPPPQAGEGDRPAPLRN